jgi:hypothetical protein
MAGNGSPLESNNDYLRVWQQENRRKAVDVVAVETAAAPATTWLIEAKYFRIIANPPKSSNIAGLAQTAADNTADTLAGLEHAAVNAANPVERNHATDALTAADRSAQRHSSYIASLAACRLKAKRSERLGTGQAVGPPHGLEVFLFGFLLLALPPHHEDCDHHEKQYCRNNLNGRIGPHRLSFSAKQEV